MVNDGKYNDLDRMTGAEAVKSPLGFIDFSQGIFYGSGLVKNSTHLEKCVNILADDYIKAVYKMMSPAEEDSHAFTRIYSVLRMLWSVHPLMINCYHAPDNSVKRLVGKVNDWGDARIVLTNLIHNVGYMHDAYSEVKMFFKS